VTVTPKLSACVLHTQITKLAKLPGATCDVASDWTRMHSSGVGGVVVGVGVGVEVGGVDVAAVLDGLVSVALGLGGGVDVVLVDGEVVPEVDVDAVVVLVTVVAVANTTFVGTSAQLGLDVVLVTAEPVSMITTAKAWPIVPNTRKASAVSAPIAAGLMIRGLTRATPLRSASRQDRPCCPGSPQYS
jgi:hypothetical protein